MLSAQNMSKTFGAAKALEGVSAEIGSGEVVSLVGENGAGKSTLLKALGGVFPWDSGAVMLDGQPYAPVNLADAETRGVALVFQELNVNRSLSIAENVMLGRLRNYRRFGFLDTRRLNSDAQAILERIGAGISTSTDINDLNLGQLKIVEVARALAADPRFVFFDESTAFLNNRESRQLLAVIDNLRKQKLGIAFVSHHLNEVFSISDRLVVLKDGRLVGSFLAAGMTEAHLHGLMVGREFDGRIFPPKTMETGEPRSAITLEEVVGAGGLGPISLDVKAGRIVGIGGIKGSGGDLLLQTIMGIGDVISGTMSLEGKAFRPRNPKDAWHHAIAYVPGDRTGEGLISEFAIEENLTLSARPVKAGIFVDRSRGGIITSEMLSKLKIKTSDQSQATSTLSGGNMQKVVLGKCLATRPRLLLLDNPTRGVDVGAKAEIYRHIRSLADDGMTILMVTEDLGELIGMADEIIVTRKGQISCRFEVGQKPSEEEVVKWMM
ncbi:ABC-type sugar transport system ATPase subunit [Rhizobium sp. BK313]|uniref:sugar ABC transporter ATP-binding protein n=1 Tax=Rhizobium sp. BK313 TaxID=2587081 RepID=UPI00105CE0F9|nr:sugar ABC transporter ATP-binding protein [Rhizobium sp. BK313]MBB3459373.1 ABC-type sugar transport system ATPase subunit [Rhizobium sp. BK313]